MSTLVIDTESNGFKYESDVIWCATAYNVEESELFCCSVVQDLKEYKYKGRTLRHLSTEEFLREVQQADLVVGQNLLQHDLPLIRKLYPWFHLDIPSQVADTKIMSALSKPDREGGHSLASWGTRLGYPKGDYTDFSKYTDEMLDYCLRDTLLTAKVYRLLKGEME